MKLELAVFVIFAAATFAQNSPLRDPQICGRPECKAPEKFKYKVGTQYDYKYSVNISSLFDGTSKNESTLQIETLVHLDFITPCEGVLQLADVKLRDPSDPSLTSREEESDEDDWNEEDEALHKNSIPFAEALNRFPLRFAFHDGLVTEVCPDEDEPNWTLNFKKAVLSLFHNTMNRLDLDHVDDEEEDIHGTCRTVYWVEGPKETSLIITKKKEDLEMCEHRSTIHSTLQSASYDFRKMLNPGKTLIKSNSECSLSVDHSIYNDISCEEKHVFEPFADAASGATTRISQRISIVEETTSLIDEQPEVYRRASLHYDHVPSPKPTSGELKIARDIIKQLCKLSSDDIQTGFSELFTQFIHTSRVLSHTALSVLYNHSGSLCPTGKKHVVDALPYLSSSAAVTLMKDIIMKRAIPEATIDEWMLTIALIPRPDLSMIEAGAELLAEFETPSIVLAVSSMVYTYCKQNEECEEVGAVGDVIQLFENRVTNTYESGDKTTRACEETLLVTLKALSNIGRVSEEFKETLGVIIEDVAMDVKIRVSAIETHRRLPCEEARNYFEEIFRNETVNSQVRIASYLQVMRCPNYLVMRSIQHALETENVNQVGSFVWSHLHNLLKSSIPSRVEIQGLLSDKDLGKKFNTDMRKFSHNYEGSMFFDEYNVGGNYESNVIFSTDSYLPRSAVLNLTVDIFGESINLFEVYGYIEGFEHFVESFFGPKGPYSAKKVQEQLPKFRWGRSADEEDKLKNQIENFDYTMLNKFGPPKLGLGMKLFGNELKYVTYNGDEEIRQALKTLNLVDHLKRILSGKEINYSKASMFLDTSYIVASGAGFPVTLNAIGTSSINMQLKGSLVANNFIENKEMDLIGKISPNMAIDIVGTMSVDVFYASTAIKIKSSMYTSSSIEGQVKVRGSKLVSLKFGIPKKTVEIFGAKSELIVKKGSLEEIQAGIQQAYTSETSCSWPTVDKTIGLKICADYHFINVTELVNPPFFLFAGPAGFRVSLQKSDPTATTYLLEYKWVEQPSVSEITITFDTPGSTIRRLLVGNLTIDRGSQNLLLLLQSSEGEVKARGKYRNTDVEKYLELGLDVNDEKKFDALISLQKRPIKNGFLYEPKFFLGINGAKVAELQGTTKLITKSGISQYDVDLKFETKRLTSKLFGYISKTDSSISSTLRLHYKFKDTNEHAVHLEFSLANRTTRNIFILNGDAKVQTTAYPNYNFNATGSLQHSGGHLETKLIINASPHLRKQLAEDPEMLVAQMFFSYRGLTNSTRFKVSASAKRPSTNLDVKAQLSYDLYGYSTNSMALLRYGKGKDVVVTVYWNHPKLTQDNFEGRLNVTIPGFSPMILDGKLKEKNHGDYMIELNCAWFSGHMIDVKGLYQDKSTDSATDHHLKLVIKSPSFEEINGDCTYYRNNTEIRIDVKADQGEDQYGLYLKHVRTSKYEISSLGRLKYKTQLYSISSLISLKEKREISVELHIDQIRDIFLSMWAHDKVEYKEAGFEVKWDANRDPNQKLAVSVYYTNPKQYNYQSHFYVSYPGRTIKGLYIFLLEDGHFNTLANLAWGPEEVLSVRFTTNYRFENEVFVEIEAEMLTPFDDWRKTAFNGGFENKGNMYRGKCSVYWHQDQHVSVDLFGDYAISSSELKCEFASTINSTVDDIPSLSASVKHCHNSTKVDSELYMLYQPKQKIAITSSWQIDEDTHTKNLTGTVTLVSPFRGFNKGLLVSKIYVTSSRSIRGEANLDLDHKEYTASVEGFFKKISKCMFELNVTTPMEKFKLINGRFGIMEEQRHVVAHVTYPTGKTGVEIRLFMASLKNFDIKFNVATPFDILQEILIVAKLTSNVAEFMAGWNNINFGVSGVWYQNKITDFEYSCKIYTPLQGLEENGAVAKLIMKEGLDFEISVKLADNQLGVLIVAKPKSKTLRELGINTQVLYNNKFKDDDVSGFEKPEISETEEDEDDEDDDDDEEPEEDPFRWNGHIKVDTMVYPTITGDVDIDQKGTVYDVVATLTLPEGLAELRNEFDFRDLFTMKNRLRASTPYTQFRMITSDYDLKVATDNQYLLAFDVNYLNGTKWIKTGCFAHYLYRLGSRNNTQYNITLDLHTPFENLPLLKLNGSLDKDDIFYKTSFAFKTNGSDIRFLGEFESEPNRTDGNAVTYMKTPIFLLPESVMSFKKHYFDYEHRIEFNFKMENNTNKVKLDTSWRLKSKTDSMAQVYLITPFKGMEKIEVAAGVHKLEDNSILARTNVMIHPINAKLNATIKDKKLNADLITDFNGKRQIFNLDSEISDMDGGHSKITGVLSANEKKHDVEAILIYLEDLPGDFRVTITPQDGGTPINIHYLLKKQANSAEITTTMKQGMKFVRVKANINSESTSIWDIRSQIETSHQIYKLFIVNANVRLTDFNKTLAFDAKTPFERIEKIQAGGSYTGLGIERKANAFYVFGDSGGSFRTSWAWQMLENMGLHLIGNYYNPNYRHDIAINSHYSNPKKNFKMFNVGAGIEVNKDWMIGSNLTVSRPARNHIDVQATMLLPKPTDELHTFSGNFKGSRDLSDIKYLAKYKTMKSKQNYGSSGTILIAAKTDIMADVLLEWNTKFLHNYVKLREIDAIHYLLYKLRTPKFEKEALIANVSYTNWNEYHNITGELFYPGNRSVGAGHINFKEFSNMNGFLNATTPFPNFTHVGGRFNMENNRLVKNSYVKFFWPSNDAFIDSKCLITEIDGSAIDRHMNGTVLIEIPVTTRHVVFADYNYTEKSSVSTGEAKVEYNEDVILEGSYNCMSESQAGHDKDSIHVELENKFVPVGADYVHQTKYSGENYKIMDFKHLRAYHLHNQSIFDVTGDLNIENRETGQTVTLKALQSNRTIQVMTNYDILDMEFKQNSRIDLGPTIWLEYDVDILNKTTGSDFEAQDIQINLSYPRRNFTGLGSYLITGKSIYSDLRLNWGKDNTEMTRTIQGSLEWKSDEELRNRQQLLLQLMHPSFEKNVTILGEYDRSERNLADLNLTIDYSNNPDQTLKLSGRLQDNSNASLLNYTYTLYGTHPDTSLQLDVRGGVNYRPRWFYSYHLVDYKRTYLPLQTGEATTRIDLDQYEIELKRKTLHELSYLWGKYDGKYPLYTTNISAIHGKNINATGEFYLNFKEKDTQLELNLTTDGSQSVHMKGFIPDARSAYFDLWREYDIDRISDIAYFLRMNHSRLIVSSLLWRPELKQDIKDAIKEISVGMYNHTVESTEYWRQYVRAEIADAISDIWQDANPMMEGFLDDLKDLKMIEEDLHDLRIFLNESYHANEFYIKDLVTIVQYIVDELSIRSHIESVPSIINEIWEVMGESGKKIQKGIGWVVEKIKTYYKNAAEFINGLFQGDSLEHLSEGLKDLVAKYDNFIKDLHVSFIRYMEHLWKQFYKMLNDNWHKTLATIEPTFIKFIHYLETIVWNASKEMIDFLYIRKTEIIENPYFSKISNFTHDLDHFYKDITGNDTIGAVYKYTKKVWVFLKEKYLKLVPFGKELQDIVNEILNEIYELRNLPSIRFLTEKYNEIEEKARWIADYFDLENRMHKMISLIHQKFVSTKLTALEAENRYREAKTKFIFEPAQGKMHLEQKLPMSWHAFNETPNFDEIPEYKALTGIPNYFSMSKVTFSNFYYNYKPFTDPTDWLPPFKAQAMLVGLEHFVTFDREIYKFQGDCTYLLAADFLDRNFSIALSYDKPNAKSHELIILVHDRLIYIDIHKNVVKLENNKMAILPFEIKDVYVYQEADILTVKSEMGFQLKCNMKFHLCIFEVSGWYFGKTAGLWGTMNNEHKDDLLTANRTPQLDPDLTFASSWAVDAKCADAQDTSTPSTQPPFAVADMCESLFSSSVSQFSTCFDRVPVAGYLDMCLDSATEEQTCTSVLAYMKSCSHMNTPLRIPDMCVRCNLVNGTVVSEGAFVSMEKNALPKSADVVFIVEAKECNKELRARKNVDEVVEHLEKELLDIGMTDNRYSMVVFGGDGVFNKPRSVIQNGQIFTNHNTFLHYMDQIKAGNGSKDIYDSISFATKLIFRPGVSIVFVLLPCSDCKEYYMKYDYTVLHQLLLESDISLHILMNDEFQLKKAKTNKNKVPFGVDRHMAFTKKDADGLIGDEVLKKSVQLPKSSLGYCTPLALETDGSIFSIKKMETEKTKTIKKIVAVFAKRVAKSASLNTCKTCECTAHNSGVSYMECFPCVYPTPMAINYGFDEDEMLSVMQPSDDGTFDYVD